ncbi:MAG: Fis family transcriptional regulator [Desulfuromonas sp.]|nr:MAG: Fis family transcriptional regulator [Desulfuromonas sp.]
MARDCINLDYLIHNILSDPPDSGYAYKSILDSIADGVISLDLERKITSVNRAAEKLIGYSRTEVVGRYCHDVLHSDFCENNCPVKEALTSGCSVVNRECEMTDSHQHKVPISVTASVLRDNTGQVIGAVKTFRDLSSLFSTHEEERQDCCLEGIYSRSPLMHCLFEILPDLSASDATVLISGESGAGKELFARAIHRLSPRHAKPMVTINCGALPENLLEAEIFGTKRGAYTGAFEDRPGRLEQAQGGTLFLDEIGDLPLPLQVKLLRVLENREYQPLGATQLKKADVRFLAASNRKISTMVEEGSFRQDLYYRINVVSLTIPPLRKRKEDIPLLINLFIDQLNKEYHKKVSRFTRAALQPLINHDYPGNVRELHNLIEQIVVLAHDGEITPDQLPQHFQPHKLPDTSSRRGVPTAEELRSTLERFNGNRQLTAQEFAVDRTTIWRWIKRLKLEDCSSH